MRLRRVVISGFKTFARRVEVSLEPGITAIVGPNGSGKSNLVDAIRWALGETNARELRGARMDEVIYAGGNGRARMGLAEVELVLDNEDGRLAVDDAEVSVSRRVVRHGDSEFRLNGDRVRLRDLERVLGTTGLTQTGYAVVAQNDIDAIIEASPAQRRALVEQAAGVRSLRAACEDALTRVGTAEVTLQRFEDLLAENEPRLAELAEQSALALEQRELTGQLASLRGSLAREEWRAARAQLRQARRRLDSAASRLESARAAEAAFASSLELHRRQLDAQRSLQREAAARLEGARLEAERARGERRRAADRVEAGVVQRAQATQDARGATAEVASRLAALESLRARAADATTTAAGVVDRLREAREGAGAEDGDLEAAETTAAEAELALRRAEDERTAADTAVHHHATQLQLFSEAAQALEHRAVAARDQVERLRRQAETAVGAQAAAAAAVTAAEAAHALAAADVSAARTAAAAAADELDAAREAARTALARSATIRGQVEGALGGRGAIAEAVDGGALVARRLLDGFTVTDPADSAAIEAALEDHLGAWVGEELHAAEVLLAGGDAREELLLATAPAVATDAGPPPGLRRALAAVTVHPGFEAVLAWCLRGAWLAPDLDAARHGLAAGGSRVVLPDGTAVTAAGIRGGGRPGRTLELAAAERSAAERSAAALEAERAAAERRQAEQTRLAGAEVAERKAGERLQAARLELVETTERGSAAAAALVAEQRRLDEVEAELGRRGGERSSLAQADAAAAARLLAAEASLAAARSAAEVARERLATARVSASHRAESLRALSAQAAELALVAAEGDRAAAAAAEAVAEARSRLVAARSRMLSAELTVLAGLARWSAAARRVALCDEAVATALRGLDEAAPDLAGSERAVTALEAERSEVAVVLARAQDEAAAAALDVEASEARVAELADAVRDDEEDEGPEPQAGDAERAEREIVRLERRIAALGPVNALAPEEHERLAARVGVLRAGRDDLGTACTDIRVMAAVLTTEIDRRFEAVFGAVSVHFQELFAELFPGGRAALRREDVEADDEPGGPSAQRRAGVEILAQPPGKKLQPLSLLSGGERALTALAVILALQQVTPSPFYVFDEVDAPLDDSNVVRFSRLLKRLSLTQQFIVVTHNHVTMAAADALHGVTSDGDGVSSVISVRFDPEAGEAVPEGNVVGLRQSTIRAAV